MKKNLLALSVAAAALAFTTVASAAIPNTWYVGARAGYAHLDTDYTNEANGDGFYDFDDAGYGVGLFGGYSVNEYFSVELGYNYFDGFDYSDRYTTSGVTEEFTGDFAIHGPELGVRLSFPLTTSGTDIFLRGGGFYAMYTGDVDDGDQLAPFVGAGVNFALTDNWALRLGYDRYFEVIDDPVLDMDLDYAYLTVGYVFGDRTPAPAPVEPPVTKTVTTSYNLDASALFGFDSDKLSEQGRSAVDQVVIDAQNAQLDFVAYDVKGYTDPIGNAEYNKGLSLRRAEAVASELQAKGVPAGSITVTGLGSADSTVGDACDGLPRNEKLKCYAPDRRVVVNVTGSTTTTEQQ
ncbi:MAG TPA: outer membrane beta-barrel protein [Candidatus Anaerobiospirillum stercoravium]|nr:outer membrane beta-barrel protein [Candidatus Anaerobiospirillum stercoravium]